MISLQHPVTLPQRKFPDGFDEGKPNLIICSKDNMWRTILSLYMESPDQCLPFSEEVLVCSQSTTTEEIELLFRRAIQYPPDEGLHYNCHIIIKFDSI